MQSARSAPPASTIGALEAPLAATADPDTRSGKTSPKTSVVSTVLQPSRNSSRDRELSRHIQKGPVDLSGSGWNVVQHRALKNGVTPDHCSTPIAGLENGFRNAAFATNEHMSGKSYIDSKMDKGKSHSTTGSKGSGRGARRPRGPGRAGGSGGRKTKRKRENDDDDDDDNNASDSSEVYTPMATTTKSGRSIQKPTSYVPPPMQSPVNTGKRKRIFRKDPESAVCKVCLRGTSPAGNMIVFCDGCNTPYHRYCHHPPIDQEAVDEVDMEWYCRQCERQRCIPVPESEVTGFVSAEGSLIEQRRKYFSRLKPGIMATLLARASVLQPSLPLFDPKFAARYKGAGNVATTTINPTEKAPTANVIEIEGDEEDDEDDDAEENPEGYDASFHPTNYPTPGQGLMATLPPDKDDDQWLVDDDEKAEAFKHVYLADTSITNRYTHAQDGPDKDA